MKLPDECWVKSETPECLQEVMKLARRYRGVTFWYNGVILTDYIQKEEAAKLREAEQSD